MEWQFFDSDNDQEPQQELIPQNILENEIEIKRLENEALAIKQKYEEKKGRFLNMKLKQMEDDRVQLTNQLDQIISMPKEDDLDLKHQIQALKQKLDQDIQAQIQKEEEITEYQRMQELEKIAQKKVMLDKIRQKNVQLKQNQEKLNMEIDVIKEEIGSRDIRSQDILQKALIKGQALENVIQKGILSEKDQALLVDTYIEKIEDAQQKRQLVIEDVNAYQLRELKQQKLQFQQKIRRLNNQRMDYEKQKDELLDKKAQYNELKKKGHQFLIDLELGMNPQKLQSKNLKFDKNLYREDFTIEEIIQKSQKYLISSENHLNQIRQQLTPIAEIQEYNKNDNIEYFKECDQQSLNISQQIVQLIIQRANQVILQKNDQLQNLLQQQKYLHEKKQKLQEKFDRCVHSTTVDEIAKDLLQQVVDAIIKESASEMGQLNLYAKKQILQIMHQSFQNQNQNPYDKFEKLFLKSRNLNLSKKDKPLMKLTYMDVNKVNSNLKKIIKKSQNQADNDITQAIFINDEHFIENQGTLEIRKIEKELWKRTLIQELSSIKKDFKQEISCIEYIKSQNILLVGNSSGDVVVHDILNEEILGIVKSDFNSSIIKISMANLQQSQVMLIGQNGEAASYFLKNSSNIIDLKDYSLKSEDLFINSNPFFQINLKDFNKSKVTCVKWFQKITLTGIMNSALIGFQNGTLVKYNHFPQRFHQNDKDIPHYEQFTGHKHPINYIMYQDNQNFISCDNSGVILIWSYHKNFLIKDVYIPFIKISQNMITQQYVPKGSPLKKFQLTDKNDKSKLQIAQQYYSEIQKEFDEKTSLIINEERINDQENYILISRNGPLEGQQQVQLHQLKIDSIQKIIISHEEQIYEIIEQQANIQQIQEFQNKLVLMKKFPHLFKSDKNKIQFIIFDIKKTSFFNLQINIEISKNDTDPQFQVYDNLYPFENPNILLLTQQYLQIFSLSTGQLVKNIYVHELLPQNQYFNFIQIDQIHRNIFLARTNYQIYQFQIEEVFPTPQEQQAIKELQKLYEN